MFRRILWTLVAFLVAPAISFGQGVLIVVDPNVQVTLPRPYPIHHPHPHPHPIPPRPIPPRMEYRIKEVAIEAKVTDQVAKVQVSQSFVNMGSRPMEVSFVFPLPYDGAIDRLTLMVDGKEYEAKLLDAKQARSIYEGIVRRNQDPALMEWVGTGMFQTSVFPVPPGQERKVTLRYTQLCRKSQGLTDFLFPLSTAKYTAKPVETLSIKLALDSQHDLKNIYSPSHPVNITRPDDKHAVISYVAKDTVPTADFRLLFDVGAGKVGSSVLSFRREGDDGYYLLLASPEIKSALESPPPKTVLFVFDRSGSMAGKKIEQAKGALKFVLNNLREHDLFNIVAYDSEIENFRPELERYNDTTRKAALGFVEGLYAGSGTNIDGALKAAMGQLKDNSRPNYVIFLTDGLPTVGEVNETKIVANAKTANQVRARMFTFGVGYDLNSRLLDALARQNFGQGDYVRPDEDIEAVVGRFYNKISAPVLTNLKIDFGLDGLRPEDGPPVNRVYPKDAHDLFAGQQLVMVGRYKKPGAAKVVIRGQIGAGEQKFDFPANLVEKSGDDSNAFIEKLWALRRVGEILDQIDVHGRNEELVKELVSLSTRHGILTPYTSFLADDTGQAREFARSTRDAYDRLESLEKKSAGVEGFAQRRFKGDLQYAERPQAAEAERAPLARTAPAAPAQRGTSGDFGGTGGAGGSPADGRQLAGRGRYTDEQDKEIVVTTVKYVGAKTFYRRNNRWVDSAVKPDQEKAPVQIKRFSQEYFDLVDRHGKQVSQYLTIEDPFLLEIDGKAYEF